MDPDSSIKIITDGGGALETGLRNMSVSSPMPLRGMESTISISIAAITRYFISLLVFIVISFLRQAVVNDLLAFHLGIVA